MQFHKAATAAALCLGFLAAPAAKADVIYSFNTTSYGYSGPENRSGLPLRAELRLRDATVASGQFGYGTNYGLGDPLGQAPIQTGDVNGFVTLSFQPFPTPAVFTPTSSPGSLTIRLLFDAIGAVTSTSIRFFGVNDEAVVSGTGNLASGFIGSDSGGCNASTTQQFCSVAGFWSFTRVTDAPATVPEPASVALFGAGLLGLAAVRRKRAA